MNLFRKKESATAASDTSPVPELNEDPLASIPKNKWQKIWPVLACGSGLFAEGYVQSVRVASKNACRPEINGE